MPELPEVETMVRGLRPALEGRSIGALRVRDPSLLQGCTAQELERQGRGAHVSGVGRRGKWVVIALGDGRGLIVIQPRMTGSFWLVPPERPEHVRLSIELAGSPEMVWYCDARRLGKIAWYEGPEAAERAFARSHGPDALEIGRADLASRLQRTGRPIKPALMDQKVLAGIGNIYADEVLFQARVHPERPASGLSTAEVARIHEAIGSILLAAIAAEGTSFSATYRTVLGLEGGFLAQNAMYGRGGQPCPSCASPIVKTRIVGLIGRPTHFCPTCQPARGRRMEDLTPRRPGRKGRRKEEKRG
jgi:formamidopyrimidine-DNA glycosylase